MAADWAAGTHGPSLAYPTRRAALIAGFGGACLCCLPRFGRAAEATMEEVAAGIFIRRGIDQDASAGNLDAIANIGFVVGDAGVLVTDSGGSLDDGRWLRAQIKAKTDKPIRWVVMSHVHPDHTFGAGAFVEDHPEFVGHRDLPAALGARGEFYRRKLADIIGADATGPVVMPTRTIADTETIDLGGRSLRFKAHGPAHTRTDLSMLDTRTGLLLPADLLFVERVPALDGSVTGWLKELDALAAMKAARAVPGHGPVSVATDAAIAPLRVYLTALRDGVRRDIAAGKGIDAAVASVAQDEKDRWRLFDDYNPRNVIESYRELEWE